MIAESIKVLLWTMIALIVWQWFGKKGTPWHISRGKLIRVLIYFSVVFVAIRTWQTGLKVGDIPHVVLGVLSIVSGLLTAHWGEKLENPRPGVTHPRWVRMHRNWAIALTLFLAFSGLSARVTRTLRATASTPTCSTTSKLECQFVGR